MLFKQTQAGMLLLDNERRLRSEQPCIFVVSRNLSQ